MRSLAFLTALCSAIAIALVMAVFAGYEVLVRDVALGDAIVSHGIHVLVLGAMIHVVLYIALNRLVAQPIRVVSGHLYGVAVGRVQRLELRPVVAELQRLVDSVNLMVDRTRMNRQHGIGADLDVLRQLAGADPKASDSLNRLERTLQLLSSERAED